MQNIQNEISMTEARVQSEKMKDSHSTYQKQYFNSENLFKL